ncbi:hypothetical protein [Paenibacillus tyrfis]|uniref:hypothetical protein n=1 Tax=Paenibacillus tyrfis TaxID=1501230 RepID=UPI000B592E48|nr:hypothetical protein [Paenibacillus tyrfis]
MSEEILKRFSYFMSEDTPIFNSYVNRKASGEVLNFELISAEDLQEMFIEENIIDNLIADLFDTDKNTVRKKRYKYDIKFGQTFSRKLMQKLKNTIDESFSVEGKTQTIEQVFIPIKIMFEREDDFIIVPYSVLENDGRPFPLYDYEGLQEVDSEAFCVRISKVKNGIVSLLDELMDFLDQYEWDDEVYFEREDEKIKLSAILYTDQKEEITGISLAVLLNISGLHPSGDIIFDTEINLQTGKLVFSTDESNFELDDELIKDIFVDCWDGISRYVQFQKELESEMEDED